MTTKCEQPTNEATSDGSRSDKIDELRRVKVQLKNYKTRECAQDNQGDTTRDKAFDV